MGLSVQESLLDAGEEPVLGPLGGSVRRTALARGAWVDLRPGWLTGWGWCSSGWLQHGAVAGREAAYVRQGGGGPPAALLLRRGRAASRPGADRRAGGAERALRPGAPRAVPDRGALPVPGRPVQRGLARRHDRARPDRGHPGGHRVAGHAAAAAAAPPGGRARRRGRARPPRPGKRRVGPSLRFELGHGDLLVMGGSCQRTWSMPCRRRPSRSGRGSACSSARAGCADANPPPPPPPPPCWSAEVPAGHSAGVETATRSGRSVPATRSTAPPVCSIRPRTSKAGATVAARWCRSHTRGGQMTFTMPVSSSRLRNTTPRAVGGRCRWVTRPATATTAPSAADLAAAAVST